MAQGIHGKGGARLLEVPAPALVPGAVLVRTRWSLVSAGTDRLIIGLAGKSLAGKARARPDQVRKVLAKIRTDGLTATIAAVRSRLAGDLPLGYSAAGVVVAVGRGVDGFRPGDRVACAGAGSASHAEVLCVPANLAVRVPDGLDLRSAATVTLGAIALQGVRRAEPALGERVGVIGLGLLGLLTVQILRAAGCHVFAYDLDPVRARLARDLGAEVALDPGGGDIEAKAIRFGGGRGLDAVVVTAASSSSEPCSLAARISRLGGRVVAVGAVGMDLPRTLFYEKELDFRLARSYGPGRYDPAYEEKGIDYPYSYVRFTEGRNLEEFLALLGRGEVDVEPLITHEFGIEEGERAYDLLLSEGGREVIGLLFRYPAGEAPPRTDPFRTRVEVTGGGRGRAGLGVGLIGAGAFARSVLLPALARMPDFRPTGVVTTKGLTAAGAARSARFRFASTRVTDLFEDAETDAVVIATRHRDHARLAAAALRAGKDVFLEKPLALSVEELLEVREAVEETGRLLMVGFNRRFAPTYREVRGVFRERVGPLLATYRINAGPLPPDHWTLDPEEGGGRILGEVCHFVDLLVHLVGQGPARVTAERLPGDGVTATLRFPDGSAATVVYAVDGDPAAGKERLEVFADGATAILDNFRAVEVYRGGRGGRVRVPAGKGHREEIRAFFDAVRGGRSSPVPFSQAAWSTLATLAIEEAAATGRSVALNG